MPQFCAGSNAIVVGSRGGIGSALVSSLEQDVCFDNVFCLSRETVNYNDERLTSLKCDITDEESIQLSRDIILSRITQVDLLFIATGILHSDTIQPEKRMEDVDIAHMQEVFMINTFAPMLFAKTFAPIMNKQSPAVIAAVSARVGSIGDNRLGGWYSYRASKSALNMYFRTLSVEMKRKNPSLIVTLLHPGTTDTKLSAPFQKNVPANKLFPAEKSANYMLDVINRLRPEDSGNFYAWDGAMIEW
ncbi:MAG: SDR family NAD(P)-dependent oxidoreductase [Gammaproteobacteria bacterium]|jgi:NAD(P)-dependent dehydrogenase (short-subunit alcohol dehydrogenase family)